MVPIHQRPKFVPNYVPLVANYIIYESNKGLKMILVF